jgi:hypothetical protein
MFTDERRAARCIAAVRDSDDGEERYGKIHACRGISPTEAQENPVLCPSALPRR